jgi:hypothetical protein
MVGYGSIASLSGRQLLAQTGRRFRFAIDARRGSLRALPPYGAAPPENPLAADVKSWVDTVDMVDTQPRQVDRASGQKRLVAAGAGASGRTHVWPGSGHSLQKRDVRGTSAFPPDSERTAHSTACLKRATCLWSAPLEPDRLKLVI